MVITHHMQIVSVFFFVPIEVETRSYCFNIFSMTDMGFSFAKHHVKCSALIQSFLSNME